MTARRSYAPLEESSPESTAVHPCQPDNDVSPRSIIDFAAFATPDAPRVNEPVRADSAGSEVTLEEPSSRRFSRYGITKPMYQADATKKLQTALQHAVTVQQIRNFLLEGANPNETFQYKLGRMSFSGTPLTLAVKLPRKDIVWALLAAKADVHGTYSFKAGLMQVVWKGPAVVAAVSTKSIGMLRLLVEHDAEVDGQVVCFNDAPNATLLYESCYVGYVPCVRFLLKRCGENDLNTPAKFQDDLSLEFTPLHIAVRRGHCETVQMLLEAGAEIGGNEQGCGPLMLKDAIDFCHLDVVKELVLNSADIFNGSPRGMDYILDSNNTVIMAATAAGLKSTRSETGLRDLRIPDIVRFLWTASGDEILDAIFRPRNLMSWVAQIDTAQDPIRKEWRTAHVRGKTVKINVCPGPDIKKFDERFNKIKLQVNRKQVGGEILDKTKSARDANASIDPMSQKFFDVLLPFGDARPRKHLYGDDLAGVFASLRHRRAPPQQVPVEVAQCLVPNVHTDIEVIWAIARGPNQAVFDHPGCQAIVMYGWETACNRYWLTFVVNVILAVLFFLSAILLRQEDTDKTKVARIIVAIIMAALWLRNFFYEIMQLLGLFFIGHFETYITSCENLVDIGRLVLSGFAIVLILGADHWKVNDKTELKSLLALAMLFRWNRVLYSARGFEATGQQMLAILHAVGSIWPFLSVVIWPLIGFINCYYYLGIYGLWRSMIIVYRMGFVGDFDVEEAEDIDPYLTPEGNPLTDGHYQEQDPKETKLHEVIGVFMILVTLSFTIVSMNILIGVLSESYHRFFERRDRLFLVTRANIVFEHYAVNRALEKMFGRLCCFGCSEKVSPEGGEPEYLWYCRQKDAHALGLNEEEDDDFTDGNVHERLTNLHTELNSMKQDILLLDHRTQEIKSLLSHEIKSRPEGIPPDISRDTSQQSATRSQGTNCLNVTRR